MSVRYPPAGTRAHLQGRQQGGVGRLPTFRGSLFRPFTECLALFWTVDAAEADTFRVLVVQDFDGVAVEDGNDGAGEVGG